ncbi:unnamed protein product [Rotaria sp. Silwood1]|nr:unnamed protein product [Rotaria sp. Silwood1]
MLANINLDHLFIERTKGLSVFLLLLSQTIKVSTHSYFNLHSNREIEKTTKSELTTLFGARKQPQDYWNRKHFKLSVISSSDTKADKQNGNIQIHLECPSCADLYNITGCGSSIY